MAAVVFPVGFGTDVLFNPEQASLPEGLSGLGASKVFFFLFVRKERDKRTS